jgi:hypothetical protein
MSDSALCPYVFHDLFDIWTHHIQPFLLPSVVWYRKRMGVVHYELTRRVLWFHFLRKSVIRCSAFRFDIPYSSAWLTNDLVMTINYFGDVPCVHLVHILEDGIVHCRSAIEETKDTGHMMTHFNRRRTTLFLRGEHIVYGFEGDIQDTMPKEDVCQCMWRAITLHGIRHRE